MIFIISLVLWSAIAGVEIYQRIHENKDLGFWFWVSLFYIGYFSFRLMGY